jgi:DNA-binding NarL/FixJ family response regulator
MPKILIVEDNRIFREVIKDCLLEEIPSAVLEEAATALAAFKKASAFLPDLILMDLRLPDGSGLEASLKIRAVHPGIKIVILTAYDISEIQDLPAYRGFRFLSKNAVNQKDFRAVVETLLTE